MKQRVTRALYDYWNSLRASRPAPERGEVDPGAIRSCLAHTFLFANRSDGAHPFRIAGTAICGMFGLELVGTPFGSLWRRDDRPEIADLIRTIADDCDGVVAGVTGHGIDADVAALEMLLLPLARSGAESGVDCVLGSLAADPVPYWLGTRPLRTLELGKLRFTGATGTGDHADRLLRGPGFVIYPAGPTRPSPALSKGYRR